MLDDRGPQLQAILIFLLIFCVVTVALRCYTMKLIVNRFAVEDWLAVATLILYIAFTTFALLSVHYGTGRHLSDVPPVDRPVAFMWRHFSTLAYIVISTLTKFVVGLFLLRICSHIKWMKIMIWVMLVVIGVYNTFYFFLDIFSAQPVEYNWLRYAPNPPKGRVNDPKLATIPTYVACLLNVIVDWALAILPMILLWNAKMDRRTKMSVCGVLAIGSIASVATIVRIPYAGMLLENPDYLYNFTDFAIWTTVEIGVALSASSLGTLRPLFRKFKLLSNTQVQEFSLSQFGGSNNLYISDQHGGHGACPEANGPRVTSRVHGDLAGYPVSHSTLPGVTDDQSLTRGSETKWFDLERASESDMALVNVRTIKNSLA